jgi:4-hydroxybenzoate polyprenyltransferase
LTEARDDRSVPICVGLDGTLIQSDVGIESLIILILKKPWYLAILPFWLLRGMSYFKDAVSAKIPIDAATLPYRAEVIDYLRNERRLGRPIVLASSGGSKYGEQIAAHLGIFDSIVPIDEPGKLRDPDNVSSLAEKFGRRGFDYMGHNRDELPFWAAARQAIVVNGSDSLLAKIHNRAELTREIRTSRPNLMWSYLKALRPHQWLKNLLVFLPALAGHRVLEHGVLWHAFLAFIAFCCAASAGYVVNDLLDLPSDRRHPRKRKRPFASGTVPVAGGAAMGLILLYAAISIGLNLSKSFLALLLIYLIGTVSYSTWLKRKAIVDVLTLAGLYTVRILAGSAATNVVSSFWLLALSMFFFMDLACVKRYVELLGVEPSENSRVPGRGYGSVDRETLFTIGTNSGLMTVLVLALYINSSDITNLYPNPVLLWGLCPVLLYWTSRIWILARRGLLHDDPLVFAVRDRISVMAFAVLTFLLWLGSLHYHYPFKQFLS